MALYHPQFAAKKSAIVSGLRPVICPINNAQTNTNSLYYGRKLLQSDDNDRGLSFCNHAVFQRADAFDFHFDHIPCFHPEVGVLGHAYAGGGAGEDDVAGV